MKHVVLNLFLMRYGGFVNPFFRRLLNNRVLFAFR